MSDEESKPGFTRRDPVRGAVAGVVAAKVVRLARVTLERALPEVLA